MRIPNVTLFQQVIYNYTLETTYILDEVPVVITFESDYDETEQILLNAAQEVTREIIEETGQEPFTRSEFTDHALRVRLRHQALATDRQRIPGDRARHA